MSQPLPPPLAYAAPSQPQVDAQHLDLLAIFHFVVGGIALLLGSVPIIHIVIGVLILSGQMLGGQPNNQPAGWIFVIVGSIFVLLGWAIGLSTIYAGLQLRRRKRRTFCIVVGAVLCTFMPFGTVLGVFSLIVLMRPGVRAMFN